MILFNLKIVYLYYKYKIYGYKKITKTQSYSIY